ncbi:unnamed protein product, partial [Protopolystoma xenopodis]
CGGNRCLCSSAGPSRIANLKRGVPIVTTVRPFIQRVQIGVHDESDLSIDHELVNSPDTSGCHSREAQRAICSASHLLFFPIEQGSLVYPPLLGRFAWGQTLTTTGSDRQKVYLRHDVTWLRQRRAPPESQSPDCPLPSQDGQEEHFARKTRLQPRPARSRRQCRRLEAIRPVQGVGKAAAGGGVCWPDGRTRAQGAQGESTNGGVGRVGGDVAKELAGRGGEQRPDCARDWTNAELESLEASR